ncbi:hypothetical protein AVEN_155736-1 [Araneus ventricosus]|uniref:DUF5641 domain-containing protein n=1 Tax=Araneus ventricosus TaxID=182803 RepID=A0A4Y2RCA9_ARAVE|nr:hypothetical protein AVEN_155736-1 [Araneus ventricosus]
MLKKARVEKLIKGRDGKVISCVLRLDGKELTSLIQLVIPLEVEQGGEMSGSRIITDGARCASKQLKEKITITLTLLRSTIEFPQCLPDKLHVFYFV